MEPGRAPAYSGVLNRIAAEAQMVARVKGGLDPGGRDDLHGASKGELVEPLRRLPDTRRTGQELVTRSPY